MLHAGSVNADSRSRYERARDRLAQQVTKAQVLGHRVRLRKNTSNLFRRRKRSGTDDIDVGELTHVLNIDKARLVADVEGMTTYETLVKTALSHGLLPAVTPELKTITVGGAVSGLGIESSSFRFGLVHETVQEMDVLLGTGDVVTCSRTANSDLFYGVPNSYGTLGYILRLEVRLMPAQPYVALAHRCSSGAEEYFAAVARAVADPDAHFVDGVVFGGSEMYTSVGRMCEQVPWTNDYSGRKIYYKSLRDSATDYLRTSDYVWRWDTDWFWCSKQFHLQNPLIRALVPSRWLGSRMYQRLMRLSHHVLPSTDRTESVIQDVAIPARQAQGFLEFLLGEIPILPIWICPFRASDEARCYTLYPVEPGLYINFGFWDVVPARSDPAWHNRQVERAAREFGGRKALYSSSFYEPECFAALYDHARYKALKGKYDPGGVFGDLYSKCVRAM